MALVRALTSAAAVSKADQIAESFKAKDITTPEMSAAMNDWYDLYYAREPTEEQDPSQRIPYTVVNKLYKTTFSEYQAETKDQFAQGVLDSLDQVRKKAMQQALIGGEVLLKPVFAKDEFSISVISRKNYRPFGRKETGEITDVGLSEATFVDGHYYTLLERRTVDDSGYLTIQYRLHRSQSPNDLGASVPLNALAKYADLSEHYTFRNPVGSIGLVYVKTPMENCVDGSSDGVSVYDPAVGLIRLININEAQLSGEFERGESRIIVSNDMMEEDERHRKEFKDHIFSGLPDGPEEVGITIFSPALRERSFLDRKAEYLRNVESLIGFKRGILSEVEAAERTATEVTSSAGDYNLTIIDFQQMWEAAVRETVRLCGVLGKEYSHSGATDTQEDAIVIGWGNGILYDESQEWQEYKELLGLGLIKPEIALAWYFNEKWDTPAALQKIREKYMPDVETSEDDDDVDPRTD